MSAPSFGGCINRQLSLALHASLTRRPPCAAAGQSMAAACCELLAVAVGQANRHIRASTRARNDFATFRTGVSVFSRDAGAALRAKSMIYATVCNNSTWNSLLDRPRCNCHAVTANRRCCGRTRKRFAIWRMALPIISLTGSKYSLAAYICCLPCLSSSPTPRSSSF